MKAMKMTRTRRLAPQAARPPGRVYVNGRPVDQAPYTADGRVEGDGTKRGGLRRPKRGRSTRSSLAPGHRLFTATIAYADGNVMLQAFHASVATHSVQVIQRLRDRFGDDVVPVAEVRLGFHPAAPIAVSLVPATIADMIRLTERSLERPSAASFVVDIEQRIEI